MMALPLLLAVGLWARPAGDSQGKPSPQEVDRPSISASEIKLLRDNNIFAPRSVTLHPRPLPNKSSSSRTDSIPAKPKLPTVTGIFLDPKLNTYQIIVEDPNESALKQFKEPKFLKAGDEWGILKVESVEADHAVCKLGGAVRKLSLGDTLPEGDWKSDAAPKTGEEDSGEDGDTKSPGASSVPPQGRKSSEAAPQTSEERGRVLDEMKRRNGKKNRPKDPDE
jgi:hypothetical protein